MSRYRLYPSAEQEAALLRHCSDARYVWNLGQEQRAAYRPGRGPAPGFAEQARQLTEARRAEPWLAAGSVNVQQQALRDLGQAWRNFFARTHRGCEQDRAGTAETSIVRRLTDGLPACPGPRENGCSLRSCSVDRIAIIGCGGSGKSHLSRSLGTLLGITRVHLDGLYYDQDWKPLDKEQFAALQRDLVTAPRWIIDGNYASSLPIRLQAADTVIFLDLPGWRCLCEIAQRRLDHRGGQHKDIGVYDRITWNFVRYIFGYRRQMAPHVRGLIAGHAGNAEVIVLHSRRAARDYLATVTAEISPRSARATASEEVGAPRSGTSYLFNPLAASGKFARADLPAVQDFTAKVRGRLPASAGNAAPR